jgi:hypothetical protein
VYKRVTSRFFVVSSFRGVLIWYDRCNFASRFINCLMVNYPAIEKRQWDGIIRRISNQKRNRKRLPRTAGGWGGNPTSTVA